MCVSLITEGGSGECKVNLGEVRFVCLFVWVGVFFVLDCVSTLHSQLYSGT